MIINAMVNVCLKARAHRELIERNDEAKKIAKHKKDILRLAQVLEAGKFMPLQGVPRKDLERVCAAISEMMEREIKQVIGAILTKEKMLETLRTCFLGA